MIRRWLEYLRNVSASSPFLRHVATLMTGTAIAQVIVFLIMMIITRLFTRETLGELGAFNSVVAIVVTVAAARFDMTLMLEHDDRNAKVMAKLAMRCILVTAVVATIAAFPLRPWIAEHYSEDVARWMPLVGVTTVFMAGAAMLQYWYNRKTDYRTIAINRIQQQVGTSGGQVLCGAAGLLTLPGLLVGQLLGQGFAFVNLLVRAKDLRTLDTTGADSMRTLMRRHWKMPILNGPNALIDAIRLNGINLMIGRVSLGDFGEFNLANQAVSIPVGLINSAVSQVFFQKLSVIEPGQMYREVVGSIKRALIIGIAPFAVFYALAPWIFPLVFGVEWQQAGYFARALIPWMCMLLVTSPISTMFVVTGTQHWLLAFAIVYCAAPLSWLVLSPYPLLPTIFGLGAINAACLVAMTVMALFAAKRYDARAEVRDATPQCEE